MSADELKELGNKLMRAHPPDYNGALSAYSCALATSQGKAAACILTNRSLAFLKLSQNDKALEDANLAIETDDQWVKGYWRKCSALMALERYEDVLDIAQEGFRLLKSDTACREFAAAWLKACHHIFRDYENVTKMPTGVTILSGNYFVILFASLDSRSSSSKAMTEESMASLLTRTAEEFEQIMGAFGQPECHSLLVNWTESVTAPLDPTISTIPDKLLDASFKKTKEFCAYLNALHVAILDIARPLVALAVIVILSRTYALNCANTCHHSIQYKLQMCLPIFEESILNTGDYIGLHLGTAAGYLDSFIGRPQDLLTTDLALMEECCRNMDKLLDMYPTTA